MNRGKKHFRQTVWIRKILLQVGPSLRAEGQSRPRVPQKERHVGDTDSRMRVFLNGGKGSPQVEGACRVLGEVSKNQGNETEVRHGRNRCWYLSECQRPIYFRILQVVYYKCRIPLSHLCLLSQNEWSEVLGCWGSMRRFTQ